MVLLCLSWQATPARAQGALDAAGPQDKLLLKVLEWIPAKGEYREWTAVGGEYSVSPNRTITVPFVGTVSTGSLALSALSESIAESLQRGLSLPTRPEVSIEVISRAPIYVLGGVETPGKVEFTPGMTALQAVALAGGFYRGGGGSMRLERDTINAEVDLRGARDASLRLRARIARLEAELADIKQIRVDADGQDAKTLASFLAEEQNLLEVRRQARDSSIASLDSRRQLALDQVNTVNEKAKNLDHQIELTRKQLADIKSLVDKGLTVATRAFDLERTLTELEGRRLDLEIGRLSTTLEINEAERDKADILTEFRTSVATDLQAARSELTQKSIEIDRATALLRESTIIAPRKLAERGGNVSIRIFVTRVISNRASTVEISQGDTIEAGDTVQVQLEPVDAPGQEQTNAVK